MLNFSDDFDDALEALVTRLPSRALRHVCHEYGFPLIAVMARGITDASITSLLQERGIRDVVLTRQAMLDSLARKSIPPDAEGIFESVDTDLRNAEHNPFISAIRDLVREHCADLFSSGSDDCSTS